MNVIAIALALIAVFSLLLLKMLGTVTRWTWLTADSPPFLVTAVARVVAVAIMAVTYITINSCNSGWFVLAALIAAVLCLFVITRFDRLRKLHIVPVPFVGPDGEQLQSRLGVPLENNVVIASEKQLRPEAARALKIARLRRDGLSLSKFMSGYGSPVNDPEALWEKQVLVDIANKLTISLMIIMLLAVMTLFWAAFVIEVYNKPCVVDV